MTRVLVTEALSEAGLALLRSEFDVDVHEDLARQGLAEEIGDYDALIVRSQTKVTAEVIERASRLRVIGRAGVGLDNVDVDAATRKGVVVINAPEANIVSAAEHTMALILAQARNVPQADAALRAGRWDRSRFQGVELLGKTLGVIGLGRVGTMVAHRALAFGMRVLAYDPFVSRDRARQLGVELHPNLEAVLVQADVVTVHLPRTAETEGLLGGAELALMQEGARVVNTSRGGIVDEAALARAIAEGRLGGAALDVFAEEPPAADNPLLALEHVVVTPHLGASTEEAQDRAGRDIADLVRRALGGEVVAAAVNVPVAGEIDELVRAFLPLAEKLGAMATGLAEAPVLGIEAEYLGQLAEQDTRLLTVAALKGAVGSVAGEPVTFVNASTIARERGVHVMERRSSSSPAYVNEMTVRADTEAGAVEVSGTVIGRGGLERLVRVFGFDLEMPPARHMAFLLYEDRPGVIGTVGTLLGAAGVNIAGMEVGRREAGGQAVMGMAVDDPIPASTVAELGAAIGAQRVSALSLPH